METVRQFDVGVQLDSPITEFNAEGVEEVVDLTGATVTVRFHPQGVASFDRVATIPNPTAGIARYETEPGDLGWWGLWRRQYHVVMPGGRPDVHSRVTTFEVEPLLGPPAIYLRPDPVVSVSLVPSPTLS